MILDNTVLSCEAVTFIFMLPCLLILAATTLDPTDFSTGKLSPVNMDSSTLLDPSITSPSTGILAPGFTITISPISISSMAISITSSP